MGPVFEYLDYRKYLHDAYQALREIDPGFSYRRLGDSLGLDGSNVYKIFNGRCHLPARCQARVQEFFGLTSREAEYFQLLVAYARERSAKVRAGILEQARRFQDVVRKSLEERELLFYRDWWTSVVRSLVEVHDGRVVFEEFAAEVVPPVGAGEVQDSFQLLAELGLVKRAASGRWKLGDLHLTAGGERKADAVHTYQRQILTLAMESLRRFPRERRDVSTLSLAVDDHSHAAICDILKESRRQIQKLAESTEHPDRVMQLAMAFFPVAEDRRRVR